MTETKKKKIDIKKKYFFPECLKMVNYKGKTLVISVITAKWLILNNQKQLDFFNRLKNQTIEEALSNPVETDEISVLVQIEAKNFESLEVKPSVNGQQSMHLYLTNSCNLRCPHCYMFAGVKNKNELSTEEVKKLLYVFSTHNGKRVTFSGGEITTRPDLTEIIQYADQCCLSIELLTNGTMWTEELVRNVTPHIKSIQISIDGYDEESNAKIRGTGNFKKSLNSIELFCKNGIFPQISVVPYFDDDLEVNATKYSEFAKSIITNYPGISVRFATDLLDGREIQLSSEQKKKYSEIVTRIYSNYYNEDMFDFPFIQQRKDNHILNNCMFGELAISSDGNVYPCSRITSSKSIGNVRDTSFEQILSLANKAEQLSEITSLKPCNECELMYICGGGCRIDHFPKLLNTDITNLSSDMIPPRQCSIENKQHFYDLMIKTNEKLYQ